MSARARVIATRTVALCIGSGHCYIEQGNCERNICDVAWR